MGKYIVKLSDGDRDWYLMWSSIADAPVTYGMTREEFEEYYQDEYGGMGMRELPERMARVEAKGTSAHDDASPWDTIWLNRAGEGETQLSMEQIINYYCRNRPDDGEHKPKPMGRKNPSYDYSAPDVPEPEEL